jgi:hypothetical protein
VLLWCPGTLPLGFPKCLYAGLLWPWAVDGETGTGGGGWLWAVGCGLWDLHLAAAGDCGLWDLGDSGQPGGVGAGPGRDGRSGHPLGAQAPAMAGA